MSSFTVGGAEKQLALLLRARPDLVRALKVKVITFLPSQFPEVEELFLNLGVRTELVERAGKSFPVFFWQLARAVRRGRPKIVHTLLHTSTGTWSRLAAWLVGVPCIFHSDLSLNPEVTRTQRLMRPSLDRLTARFLPNAKAIADSLALSGVPRQKIMVVPNGIDLSRFSPSAVTARAEWQIPEDATVAGYLGMLRPAKRPQLILEAVLRLPLAERPDYIVFAGDGPLMPMMQERIETDSWLKVHCRLLGVVEDTPAFLAGLDYLVLSSDREGLPNAVLEAMAMEKPIVATRVSDVPRLIEGLGFLAEPKEAASLAQAIGKMQRLSPEERQKMGQRGRARALEQYELSRAAERFWNAHLDVLSQNHKGGES